MGNCSTRKDYQVNRKVSVELRRPIKHRKINFQSPKWSEFFGLDAVNLPFSRSLELGVIRRITPLTFSLPYMA